ncbi:MAG: T9SS type A sorting domain-containing protein, partial [Bacteroidota bacterium]
VTLVTTTMNDANGNPGFYEFPNLLLDEDYNTGATADPAAEGQPLYTISVDPNQTILTDNGFVPTMTDVNANDLEDSDDFAGVVAIPFQGSEDTAAQDPETDENPIASYDFGVAPSLSIGSTVFSDAENDGLLNNADAGIDGVSVNLNQVFGVDANGNVDINNDGIFDANDDGFLDGFPVIDGQIDFNRDGVVDMDDDGTITGMDGDLTVVDGQLSGVPAGADQTFQIDMQTTSGGGNYFFDGLYPGDYQVEIPASNFDMGTGALAGTPISSTPTVETDDGAANIDNDDNGIQAGGSGTATVSPIITLSAGDEPTDGGTETGQANDQDDGVDANGDMTIDFGFVAPINDLATTIVLVPNSDTNGDGQYDVGETADFTFTVFNQGTTPASDVTITNYVPSQLTPSPDGTSGITNIVVLDINGTPRVVPVTVTKVGNDYVIDFGDDPDNWLQPGEQISFDVEYIINEGNATDNIGDPIINIIEISEFDVNNDGTGDTDVDSTPDAIDDNNFGENPRDNNNDNVIDEDALTNPTTDDEDDHDFAEITADIVLPVELLDFKARASKDHIHLTWSTATETNNSHFELERSEDGKTFKQITRIQGQGTTLEQTDYNYSDREAIPNVLYYYRLKQVDLDGVFEYSEVRTAQLEAEAGNLSIYPNPIGQEQMLQVRFFAKERVANFQIIDIHGRIVLSIKEDLNATGWNTISIDIANLPTGTYLLLDASGNTQRFIKNLE